MVCNSTSTNICQQSYQGLHSSSILLLLDCYMYCFVMSPYLCEMEQQLPQHHVGSSMNPCHSAASSFQHQFLVNLWCGLNNAELFNPFDYKRCITQTNFCILKKLPHLSKSVPLQVRLNMLLQHIILVDKPCSSWVSGMECVGLVMRSTYLVTVFAKQDTSWFLLVWTRRNGNHRINFYGTSQMALLSCGTIMKA
jgi:hypothetical protein